MWHWRTQESPEFATQVNKCLRLFKQLTVNFLLVIRERKKRRESKRGREKIKTVVVNIKASRPLPARRKVKKGYTKKM